MKKKLSLVLAVLAFCGGVSANAQTTYRKSWDFTKWSDETIANLKAGDTPTDAGGDWSYDEKGNKAEADMHQNNCYWLVSAAASVKQDDTKAITANGTVIKELEGLQFTFPEKNSRNLAIALNYPTTSLGTYYGASYFWLGGSKIDYFVIPHVEAGTTIKIGLESHKPAEARGVELYIVKDGGGHGTKLKDPDGVDVATPTVYADQTWLVTPGEGDAANEDGTYNIQVYNTNGCHLYYITVGDGDSNGAGDEPKNVLLVSNSEDDVVKSMFEGVQWVGTVAGTGAISLDDNDVKNAEVVLVSNNIAATDAVVASLKGIVAYKPVVNLSAALYDGAWGKATAATSGKVELTEAYAGKETVSNLEGDPEIVVGGTAYTLELGDYFKNDAVIATVDGKPAIHIHNANRNAYIGAPVSAEADAVPTSGLGDLVIMAAETNKAATATATPVITPKQANQETTVTITCGTAGATIYYTVDSTEPTEASTVYTEPIAFHEKATVKAIAKADGYNLSAVASAEVAIATQVATPEIAVAKNGATSTVTLTCATEGADIYYNFGDFSASTKDIDMLGKKYTEPIVLSEPTMIYAKAVKGEDALDSEMASYYVAVADVNSSNIRLDVVSRFTADYSAWSPNHSGATYLWGTEDGKNNNATWEEGEVKTLTPAEGATVDLDWKIVSKGQKLCLENGSVEVGVGDSTKTAKGERGAARFFDSVEDLIGSEIGDVKLYTSKNFLGTKSAANEENTDNATVESTKKFTAPFDVVVYLGNGKGKEKHADLEISEDGQTWTKAADLNVSVTQRYIKKTRVSIDKDSYVRVLYKDSDVNVADIVILNNGEESKKYDAAELEAAGIEDVEAVGAEVVRTEIYNINGVLVPELTTGVNIVRTYYSDGSVKTEKVLSK